MEASKFDITWPQKRLFIRGEKVCQVCGDKSLAHHFGALACETCKAFFRRNALRKSQDLKPCSEDERCVITKATRRFCSWCRLKKCFDVGMKAELIFDEQKKQELQLKIERKRNLQRIGTAMTKVKIKNENKIIFVRKSPAHVPQSEAQILIISTNTNRDVDGHASSSMSTSEDSNSHAQSENVLVPSVSLQNCVTKSDVFDLKSKERGIISPSSPSSVLVCDAAARNSMVSSDVSDVQPKGTVDAKSAFQPSQPLTWQLLASETDVVAESARGVPSYEPCTQDTVTAQEGNTDKLHYNIPEPAESSVWDWKQLFLSPSSHPPFTTVITSSVEVVEGKKLHTANVNISEQCRTPQAVTINSTSAAAAQTESDSNSVNLTSPIIWQESCTSSQVGKSNVLDPSADQVILTDVDKRIEETKSFCENSAEIDQVGPRRPRPINLTSHNHDQLPSDPNMYWRLPNEERLLLAQLTSAYNDTILWSLREYRSSTKLDLINFNITKYLEEQDFQARKAVDFVKRIEDFQSLTLDDQIACFKHTISQAICIRTVFILVQERKSLLMMEGELPLDIIYQIFPHNPCHEWGTQICQELKSLVKNDVTIYVLLHCILLFDPTSPGLLNRQGVSCLREKYLLLLRHYLQATFSFQFSESYFKDLQHLIVDITELCAISRQLLENKSSGHLKELGFFEFLVELNSKSD